MNAKELMAGNYVEYCGKYYKIVDILTFRNREKFTLQRTEDGEEHTIYGASCINPIKLSKEILSKIFPNCDFKYDCTAYLVLSDSKKKTSCYIRKYGDKYYLYILQFGIGEIDIESVHHLQNLLRVLKTGIEIQL